LDTHQEKTAEIEVARLGNLEWTAITHR